jgi:hypothetical protein
MSLIEIALVVLYDVFVPASRLSPHLPHHDLFFPHPRAVYFFSVRLYQVGYITLHPT